MKKFVSMLIVVMLLVGLVLSSFAVIDKSSSPVLVAAYLKTPTQITSKPNATIPQGATTLPQTGGIPMFAFMGTGVLLIVIAVVISGKKQKTAK